MVSAAHKASPTVITSGPLPKSAPSARDPEAFAKWHGDEACIYEDTKAAHVHDLTPAADLLHGGKTVVYVDAGYQEIEKREGMQGRGIGFCVAMPPGKRRALPDTPGRRVDDLI